MTPGRYVLMTGRRLTLAEIATVWTRVVPYVEAAAGEKIGELQLVVKPRTWIREGECLVFRRCADELAFFPRLGKARP